MRVALHPGTGGKIALSGESWDKMSDIKLLVKPIINHLFWAEMVWGNVQANAIGETEENAIQRAAQRLKSELDKIATPKHHFEVVETSQIKIFRMPILSIMGLVEHYYLSESPGMENSVGWGSKGLELQGKVRVTQQQLERISHFITTARYNIEVNNCEHFANYVYYGLNFSTQQQVWWKSLGAKLIRELQDTNNITDNITHLIGNHLNANLTQVKIENAKKQIDDIAISIRTETDTP